MTGPATLPATLPATVPATFRGYRASDAAGVAVLVNVIDEHAGGRPLSTPGDIQAMVTALVPDIASGTRIGFATGRADHPVAFALNLPPPADGFRFDAVGGVHPRWRGRGIGRELLSWQLTSAARLHEAAGATRPWQVRASAIAGDRAAARLYRRFGLDVVRRWLKMSARIEPVIEPAIESLPGGLRATAYHAEYEHRLHALHMAVFADHWNYQVRGLSEWAALTVRSANFAQELSRVALAGDEPVGYVLAYHHADPGQLFVGQIGVHRRWRGHGLGAALVNRVLGEAAGAGKHTASLVTDAGNPTGAATVARRTGFTVDCHGVTYAAQVPAS